MKKFSNIILVVLLLIGTSGVTLSKHYCMGQLIQTKFGHVDKVCEGMEDMPGMEDHCCDNEFINLKVEDDFNFLALDFPTDPHYYLIAAITFLDFSSTLVEVDDEDGIHAYSHPPPRVGHPLIYITVQSFLL